MTPDTTIVGVESLPVAGVELSPSTELMVGGDGAVVSTEKLQVEMTSWSSVAFLTVAVAAYGLPAGVSAEAGVKTMVAASALNVVVPATATSVESLTTSVELG
ncbi:MAG: hypothetical protein M3349_04085 [Actinomycetota bacterium]|nr:hypothetical protein [Actinomycetota bacterium]